MFIAAVMIFCVLIKVTALGVDSLPQIDIQESCENARVALPVVLHSMTRSYAAGPAGIVLVNIGAREIELQVPTALDSAQRHLRRQRNGHLVAHGRRRKENANCQRWGLEASPVFAAM